MLHYWMAAVVISTGSAMAADYKPKFDPSLLKGPEIGMPNEVLVLGTPHLQYMPKNFEPKSLEPLLTRLAAWKPEIITIEALSGAQCDFLRRYSVRYADTVKSYCWNPAPAQSATGLDVPAAIAETERLLATWPSLPSPAQRRHLAAAFMAAGDQVSAMVQWLRLSTSEQIPGDGLDKALVERLKVLSGKRNEYYLIAAPLAARLGLERVYPVDDHTADSPAADAADEKAYGETMQRLWDNPATAKRKADNDALYAQLQSNEGMLAMYRFLNQPDQAQLVYESDFGAATKDRSSQQYGRNYLGYWETRNLRMVSNIREILGAAPGKRTLTIVGASHKGYFEAYLNMMHDVKLIDGEAILR